MEKEEIKRLIIGQYDYNNKAMNMIKEFLFNSERLNIIAGTNSAGIASRAAETLIRLGYITYENIKTETVIEHDKRKTRFVITVKKTPNFLKLYNENLERKKKLEAEREAQKKKTNA